MARKLAATKTTETAPDAQAPKTYQLTEKGTSLAPRAESLRGQAWALLVANAGVPGGQVLVHATLKAEPIGAITGTNLFGWAKKQGLIA